MSWEDKPIAERVNVNKTYILQNKGPSVFTPCSSKIKVKDNLSQEDTVKNILNDENDNTTVFVRTENDNKPDLLVEDRQFLRIMEKELNSIRTNRETG